MNDDRELSALDFSLETRLKKSEQDRDLVMVELELARMEYQRDLTEKLKSANARHDATYHQLHAAKMEILQLKNERDGALEGIQSGLIALAAANARVEEERRLHAETTKKLGEANLRLNNCICKGSF